MTPPNGLLTRARVIAELESLSEPRPPVRVESGETQYYGGRRDAYAHALALVRRLAPEGVDVDGLAEVMASRRGWWPSYRPEDFDTYKEWNEARGREVASARALILRHVRPVAEPVPVQKCPVCEGTGVVGWPPGVPADVRTTVAGDTTPYPCPLCAGARVVNVAEDGMRSLTGEERRAFNAIVSRDNRPIPCAGCREVLAAAGAYRDVPEQNAVAHESARAVLMVALSLSCTCGQRPGATAP